MRLKPAAQTAVLLAVVTAPAVFFGISNFQQFATRAKQGECHSYLRMLGEWEQAYFEKHGEFTESADALGATAQPLYAYVIGKTVLRSEGQSAHLVERIPASIRQTLHVSKGSFVIACVGDLDDDEFVDVWTVSSDPRKIGRSDNEAGRVFQHLDDVRNEAQK